MELFIDCMELLIIKNRRNMPINRVISFTKRLLIVALVLPTQYALTMLAIVRQIFSVIPFVKLKSALMRIISPSLVWNALQMKMMWSQRVSIISMETIQINVQHQERALLTNWLPLQRFLALTKLFYSLLLLNSITIRL